MEPIGSFLTGERLKLAELQDYVIDIIYSKIDASSILYGGTAIWRCYGGNRFSEDIDIYMKSDSLRKFVNSLPAYGLEVLWRNPDFKSNIRIGNISTSLLLESKEGGGESTIRPFVRTDGTATVVEVLSPTELMTRKIEAYLGRRFIRDIYDLLLLTRFLDKRDYTVRSKLSVFLEDVKEPVDEKVLRALIYSGKENIGFSDIVQFIKRWINEV
ncbi:MAG: nucleotidyl transferase AbiEii/AbiGii toxin family protein [Thermoplasmata archaeon]